MREEVVQKLAELRKEKGLSRSWVINEAVLKYIEDYID